MAISNVNVGTNANDGLGDPLRTAFQKINDSLWYLETTKGTGGGGGGGTVDLTNYATITYVGNQLTPGLANVTGVNLNILNSELANIRIINLDNLNNALANVNYVNLNALNNALANIKAINLSDLNNALANVNAVNLTSLNNALANLSLINLTNLGNALAQIDFSLLSNVSNLVSTVAANAPGKVGIVSNLNTPGTVTGQSVLNNSDNKLYVWNGTAWTSAAAAFTPNANSISGVQVVNSLPGTGNFEGRQVLNANALYIYSGGAWKSATEAFTPTANSLTAVQIFTGASLPTTTAADSGRTLFWTNTSNLYINVGGSWNNYNSYIQGSGSPTLGAGSVNSAAIQNGAITADKIVSGAIIVGKIAAGAVRATELDADAVTSDKILANAVVAGKIAAGAVKADQIEAGAITSAKIAADAIVAGKIAAGAISATEIAAGAIGANQIAANAIVSSKIAAANIFAINLAANAVTANAIEAFAITADKIRANAIQSYHLTANSVTANAIETNSITSAKIRANAITAVQLAALSVYADALQANVITSDKINANAITAREIATLAVYTEAIQANAITVAKIAANSITAVQLAANAVYANAIQSNAIESDKIAANAITAAKIAVNSIYANALQANSVTTASLAANSITSKHIQANTITAAMIDSRGLVIRNAAGSVLLGDGVLANTLIVYDNNGSAKSLASVVTPSGETAIQFIGTYASTSAADAAGAGTNNVAKITGLSNNAYIKRVNGTWELFLSNGDVGTASFAALIYYNTSQVNSPGAPSGGSYNFSTNTLTPPTGWSTTPPVTGTDPTWATNYIFTGTTGTVTAGTWATPYVIAEKATDGKSVFGASIFIQQSSTPSAPSGGSFNFSTSTLTAPSGWSVDLPTASTTPTWIANFIFSTDTAGATVTAGTWINVRKFTQSGQDGGAGVRGNLRVAKCYASGYVGVPWDTSFASGAITEVATDCTLRARDEVTLFNAPENYSETRFWTGTSWSCISAYINGGLVVNGTISTNQLAADSVSADKICSGAISADKIAACAITASKIAADAITVDKLNSGTTTSLIGGQFSLGTGSGLTVGGACYIAIGSFCTNNSLRYGLLTSSSCDQYAFVAGNSSGGANPGSAGVFVKSAPSQVYNGQHRSQSEHASSTYGARGLINNLSLQPISQGFLARHDDSTSVVTAAVCGDLYACSSICRAHGALGARDDNGLYGTRGVSQHDSGFSYSVLGVGAYHLSDTQRAAGFFRSKWTNTVQDFAAVCIGVDFNCGKRGIDARLYTTGGVVCSGAIVGYATGISVYSVCGTMTPFTGSHDAYLDPSIEIEVGDIVIDVEPIAKKSVSDVITRVALSNVPNQKSVVGVYTGTMSQGNLDNPPTAVSDTVQFTLPEQYENKIIGYDANSQPIMGNVLIDPVITSNIQVLPEFMDVHLNNKYININSLGEGQVNVCGENGNIEVGDLITTSSMPGKGMKQADDIIRNYTVGKAREAVTFSSPTEVKQIAVIYHCG